MARIKKNESFRIIPFLLLLFCFACSLTAGEGKEGTRFRKAKNGFYVIAHRGAHQGIPENSLPACQKAIDLGCDFVEIDVRTTKDGKFICMHNASVDEYVEGLRGKVTEMTLEEIRSLDIGSRTGPQWKGTRIPVFEEILRLCQGKIGIYLDLKDAPVPDLVNLISKYRMEREVVWYLPASRTDLIKQLGSVCPDCIPMPDPGPEKNIKSVYTLLKAQVLATDMQQLNPEFVKTAHGLFAKVFVDEDAGTIGEWEQILKWGTDGIQTDHPEELISFLKRRNKSICE